VFISIFLYEFGQEGVYPVETQLVNPERHPGWCESLYELQAAKFVLYGRALGLSHVEAEDVLQETFVALLRLQTEPDNVEHYTIRSYRNRALNYRRSLWRRVAREFESARWFERSADERPAERQAMRALAELPREQREAIVLKLWHRYTFEEMGRLLDTSPNTIAGRYRYGLQKLRVLLKGAEYERTERFGDTLGLLDASSSIVES